ADSRAFCTAGSNRPINTAMMAMTTSNSKRVKARRACCMAENSGQRKCTQRKDARPHRNLIILFDRATGASHLSALPERIMVRRVSWALVAGLALLVLGGCRSRPPYEGKSVAELETMLHASDPGVQARGAF